MSSWVQILILLYVTLGMVAMGTYCQRKTEQAKTSKENKTWVFYHWLVVAIWVMICFIISANHYYNF